MVAEIVPCRRLVAHLRGGFRRDRKGHRDSDTVIGTQRRTGRLDPSVCHDREDPVDRRVRRYSGVGLAHHVEVRLQDDRLCLRGAREVGNDVARSIDLGRQPKSPQAVKDVRPNQHLLLRASWQRRQPSELSPHDRGFQPRHP